MILFHRKNFLTPTAALLISSITLLQPLPAQEQSSGQHRVWKVKESSMRLWIEKGMLVYASEQGIVESIPLSAIKALTYETTSDHPAVGMMRTWIQDTWASADGAGEAAGFVLFPLAGGVAILSPFLPLKSTRHLVSVEWQKDLAYKTRVFLVSKADARSLLSELQKATGIHWSDASQIGSSKHLALEPPPAKGQDSLGRLQHGRLVFVDRGYAIPSLEIVPIPPSPADCTFQVSQSLAELEQARRNFETALNKDEPLQTLAPSESTKTTLRLNISQPSMKSILRNSKPCRWPSSVPPAK